MQVSVLFKNMPLKKKLKMLCISTIWHGLLLSIVHTY